MKMLLDSESESDGDFSNGSSDNFEPRAENRSCSSSDEDDLSSSDNENEIQQPTKLVTEWSTPDSKFEPRKRVSDQRNAGVELHIRQFDSIGSLFGKMFPRSLFIYITQCTNDRLDELCKTKDKYTNIKPTDIGEIKILI